MQEQFRNLYILFITGFILAVGGNNVFAQCGADGTQPCNKTLTPPKKKVPSKTKTTAKQSLPPANRPKTISRVRPKSSVPRTSLPGNSLLSKLLGDWNGTEGDSWSFLPNGTGSYYAAESESEEPCQKFRYTLSDDILRITSKTKCSEDDPDIEVYQIGFNEEGQLSAIAPNEDGSFGESQYLWSRPVPDMSDVPFPKRILGKWTDGDKNYWIFSANGTGSFMDKDTVCQKFKYILDENLLQIIPKSTKRCEVGDQDFDAEENYRIEFDETNQLGATLLTEEKNSADEIIWWTKVD